MSEQKTLSPKQIQSRYNTIQKNMEKWCAAEVELQGICTHPNVTKKYRGDTGNWDRSADSYWIEWKCPDCHKQWSTDQ